MRLLYFLMGAATLIGSAAQAQKAQKAKKPNNEDSRFPVESDYRGQDLQARVAYPAPDGTPRVWVKGRAEQPWFRLEDLGGRALTRYVKLTGPHYTTVANAPREVVRVAFAATESGFVEERFRRTVWPKDGVSLTRPRREEAFTVMAYGCFEPFRVGDQAIPVVLDGEFGLRNQEMRAAFRATALAEPQPALRKEATRRYPYSPPPGKANPLLTVQQKQGNPPGPFGKSESLIRARATAHYLGQESLQPPVIDQLQLPPAKLVIGTGDQVYLDTDYDYHKREHPLTGWTYDNHPQPRWGRDTARFAAHVARTYAAYGNFETLNDVFAQVPSLSVWDDHEIRDGWGSHGDEYLSGRPARLNPDSGLAAAYRAARRGYLDHQYAPGPGPAAPTGDSAPLHQEFVVGDVPGFAFDLRSQRNSVARRVIGHDQKVAFENWVSKLTADPTMKGREVLIVSSMPFFKSYKETQRRLLNFISAGEARDDNADGWDSPKNRNAEQRDSLVAQLVRLRKADVRPILLSGDIHEGAVTEVWYSCEGSFDARVLAYELIASGLSHASLERAKLKDNLQFLADAQRKSKGSYSVPAALTVAEQPQPAGYKTEACDRVEVEPCVRKNAPALNFGAIEFGPTATNLHLFIYQRKGVIHDFVTQANWDKTWSDDLLLQEPLRNGFRPTMPDFVYTLNEDTANLLTNQPRMRANEPPLPPQRSRPGPVTRSAVPYKRPWYQYLLAQRQQQQQRNRRWFK